MINWNSSALWGIIGVVAGIFISLVFYLIGKKRRILTYNIQVTQLITEEISAIPNLEILYNKVKVDNLTATNVELKNVGNEIIEKENFASLSPLQIHIENGDFFTFCVHDLTDDNTNVHLEQSDDNISIIFEFLKPKSSFSLLIYHTGVLEILGELKNGKIIDNKSLISQKIKILKYLLIIVAVLIGIYIIFRYLLPLILIILVLGAMGGVFDDYKGCS